MAELVSFLDEQFNVSNVRPENLIYAADVYMFAMARKHERTILPDMTRWNKKRKHTPLTLDSGTNTTHLLLRSCSKRLFSLAALDPLRGSLSYYKMKRNALLLSRYIRKMKGDKIGILLPAVVPTTTLILACQLAGKLPVMINWKELKETSLETILTSWIFLDRPEKTDLVFLEPKLTILEELKADIPIYRYFLASIYAFFPKKQKQLQDIAVELPSGPLSHKEVLTIIKEKIDGFPLYSDDRMLFSLPPYTPFGFCIGCILPYLLGLRVLYDPACNESTPIDSWNITIINMNCRKMNKLLS
jgi:long-chain-fatty-acid--[acyl-carrier-protein] ligase